MLAGGGMRTGQVIGETNRLAEYAVKRPVTFQEVFATLYTNLGINLSNARSSRHYRPAAVSRRIGQRPDERIGIAGRFLFVSPAHKRGIGKIPGCTRAKSVSQVPILA